MHTIQNISKIFIEAEKNANLFDYRYNGFSLWWFVRGKIFDEIYYRMAQVNISSGAAETLKFKHLISKAFDLVYPNKLRNHKILTISTSSARRDQVNSKDFDIFFDFISWTFFKDDYAVLETPDRRGHSKKPFSPVRYYGDYLIFKGNLWRKLSFFSRTTNDSLKDFSRTVSEAFIKFGFDVDNSKILSIIKREYAYIKAGLPLAEKYLSKIRPEIVLVECGYAPSRMLFQYAAKKLGIPVMELQHGLIVPNSIGYFFGITSVSQLEDSPFPDLILVYGPHFKEILLKNHFLSEQKIIIFGYPYLWSILQKRNHLPKSSGNILIASQPEYTDFFIKMAYKLATTIINRRIILKLHPNESISSEQIKELASCGNIKLIAANKSIYVYFNEAEYHIAIGSMTHLEAISFGLKTIIVNKDGFKDYFAFLTELGIPTVKEIDDLLDILNNYPDTSKAYNYVRNNIFSLEQNPIKNYESFLKKITNR